MQLSPFLTVYCAFLSALLGLAVGSFVCCLAGRVLRGESMRGRSHCDGCGHVLSWRDLVPVASYLRLGGRCRYCGARVPGVCLWAEIICGAAFAGVFLRFGLSLRALELMCLAGVLLAVSLADMEAMLIPDRFIAAGLVVRAGFILAAGDWAAIGAEALESLISALCVSLPVLLIALAMDKLLKKETMGGGDIKLLFMAGAFLTWRTSLLALLAACLCGLVFALATRRQGRAFPFGPSIAAGAFLSALFGAELIGWYLGLFGL